MKKLVETIFVCANCGNEFPKWSGQCSACHEWNTLKEIKGLKSKNLNSKKREGHRAEIKNLGKTQSTPNPSFNKEGNKYIFNRSMWHIFCFYI